MTEKNVTVLVAVRDEQHTLPNAIESITKQNTKRKVYISIFDDGSIDKTQKMVEYLNKRSTTHFQVFCHRTEKSIGQGAARNRAEQNIDEETEYLAFLDGDDVWLPDFLESRIKCLEDSNADICYGGVLDTRVFWKEPGVLAYEEFGSRDVFQPQQAHKNASLVVGHELDFLSNICNIATPSATIMRRKLFQLVGGFPEGIVCGEDGVLWRRLAEAGRKFAYDPNKYSRYCLLSKDVGIHQSSALRLPATGGKHLIGDPPYVNGKELDGDWRIEMSEKFGPAWYDNLVNYVPLA